MDYFKNYLNNPPLLMVMGFLLLTLLVGLYYSRKTTTLREYAIGNKQFSTATLVATVLASNYAACLLMNNVEQVHSLGIYWVCFMLLTTGIPFWLISQLAIRMGTFMHNLSLTESIGAVYGTWPRLIASFSCICSAIASIALQIQVMSKTISMCVGVGQDSKAMTILATAILVFYSAFGGIRAVTFTDALQFITFTVIIPLLVVFMFSSIDKPATAIIPFLKAQPRFQLDKLLCLDRNLISTIALILTAIVSYIEPVKVQRIYMSSGPIQAKKVFLYAGFFSLLIDISMLLIGLFVFIAAPTLSQDEVWPYVMNHIKDFFKGFVFIALLAMDMSTADSDLNNCAVIVSYDIVESMKKIKLHALAKCIHAIPPLWLARGTSAVIGICAMFLAFSQSNLLALLKLMFNFFVPIITAPFILAIFGFRGSSLTASIGMTTGALCIWSWKKWVSPGDDGISGDFLCMLANGLAMLAAHYLLPQPKGTGWVAPDKNYQQRQQEKERIARRNQKARKDFFLKENLAKLKPNSITLISTGMYMVITSLASICYYYNGQAKFLWIFAPLFIIGTFYIVYMPFLSERKYNKIPDWIVGKYWFLSLLCCLPLHLLSTYCVATELIFPLVLFFMHGAVMLWILPLYWSIRGLVITSLAIMNIIYCYKGHIVWLPATVAIPLLGFGLLLLVSIAWARSIIIRREQENLYFKQQQKRIEAYKLKSLAYTLAMPTTISHNILETEGSLLEKAIQNVTQSISFSDENTTFYKEDFQAIIHKFSEWATYFKQRAKSQEHALLQPSVLDLDTLIDAVEIAYEKENGDLPGLWIEPIKEAAKPLIVGDKEQLVRLFVRAISHISKAAPLSYSMITLQLHDTQLQYKKSEPIDNDTPSFMTFPAFALVFSHTHVPADALPKIASSYGDDTQDHTKRYSNAVLQKKVDFSKQEIELIIRSHYGHLALPNQDVLVVVLPQDITQIRAKMLALSLPRETGTTETTTLTLKEQAVSLTQLIEFHDWVCRHAAVEPVIISETLLLLRRCYGFKRHLSGQLFYLRAVGIATWVTRWVGYHPKLIYAALLYDLVRYTRLPLSYIKANYNLGVFCFVENVLRIDSRTTLQESLFSLSNRFKEALEKEQLSVLYIKLAERLYDLEHAAGYRNVELVKTMAKESLTIDVPLAKQYQESVIAVALEKAAKQALDLLHNSYTC